MHRVSLKSLPEADVPWNESAPTARTRSLASNGTRSLVSPEIDGSRRDHQDADRRDIPARADSVVIYVPLIVRCFWCLHGSESAMSERFCVRPNDFPYSGATSPSIATEYAQCYWILDSFCLRTMDTVLRIRQINWDENVRHFYCNVD